VGASKSKLWEASFMLIAEQNRVACSTHMCLGTENTESVLMFKAEVQGGISDLCVNLRVGGDVLGKRCVTPDVLL
jgi:hypothetical protein